MSKLTTRQASANRGAIDFGSDDLPRTRTEKDNMYEMLFAINNIKYMNKRYEEARAEFRNFRKEYEIHREQQTISTERQQYRS
jgi:hypothetical protein